MDSTQAFLTPDAVLRLALNVSDGLIVNPEVIERVDEFLAEEIEPIRRRYASLLGQTAEVSV